ncbi:MAG: hypothetical protein JST79_17180 [Acidobacteria bacterium]|nr:hypothetical protein [Acidobacteriota bacterium]
MNLFLPMRIRFGRVLSVLCLLATPTFLRAQEALPEPGPSAAVAAKKEGVVRIGLVPTSAQLGNPGTDAGEGIRATLGKYLSGVKVETVSLAALLPVNVNAEAQEKQCDFVLYSTLTQQQGGHGGFGFLKGATAASGMVPMMGMGHGVGGAMAAASASAALNGVNTAVSQVKAKSEVTFSYKLIKPGTDAPVLSNALKAKASSDGQDIITPLIEQAASAVVSQVNK